MNFNDLVKRLLNEMAIEKESDVVYLSQLQNIPRSNVDDYDSGDQKSFRMITSKNYPKVMHNTFAPKIKYPIRIIINDTDFRYGKSRADVSKEIAPIPGVITFIYNMYLGAAGLPTPFIVGHNVGHTLATISRYGKEPSGFGLTDQHGYDNPLDSLVHSVVDDIIKANPNLSWWESMYTVPDWARDDWYHYHGYVNILTPNLSKISEGFIEWVSNLVGLYMKYGRINFRVGSAKKIEEFIDKQLKRFVGKTIALS